MAQRDIAKECRAMGLDLDQQFPLLVMDDLKGFLADIKTIWLGPTVTKADIKALQGRKTEYIQYVEKMRNLLGSVDQIKSMLLKDENYQTFGKILSS